MTDKLLVVAGFDSQLKVASHIARGFVEGGWSIDVRIPRKHPKQVSGRQLTEYASFPAVTYCSNSVEEILQDCMSFSAILLIVNGDLNQAICHSFYLSLDATKSATRPVIITGFVGVGLFDTYIGYQRRLLSDVLFLNAKRDLEDCLAVCRTLGIQHDGLVVSGLPFLGVLHKSDDRVEDVNTVLFAGQPDVPERIIDRIYMLEGMLEYARRFPDRKVLFKPRHKPGEKTLHPTLYHYETLLSSFLKDVEVPENFEFVYGPIGAYLERAQLFVTVSSTAAFEAIEYDCQIALIDDLGITEKYGNNYFMSSGMLCSYTDLYADHFPVLNWDWIEDHMDVTGSGTERVFETTRAVQQKNRHEMQLPYNLGKLQRLTEIRVQLEQTNKKLVRNPYSLANFFLKRAVKERRIL